MANPLKRAMSSSQASEWHGGQRQITVPSRAHRFSAVLWTPGQITTNLWLDFDDPTTVTLDAGRVSEIKDKSGNARHASNSTSGQRPIYVFGAQNSRSIGQFSANGHLESAWTVTGVDWHVFAVASLESSAQTFARLVSMRNAGVPAGNDWNTTTGWATINRNGTGNNFRSEHNSVATANTTLTYGEFNILAASLLTNLIRTRLNGGTEVTAASGNSLNTTAGVRIGASWDSARWAGMVGEVIAVNAISTANRENIEGYLAHKWGIASKLPVGHPYASAPPTV